MANSTARRTDAASILERLRGLRLWDTVVERMRLEHVLGDGDHTTGACYSSGRIPDDEIVALSSGDNYQRSGKGRKNGGMLHLYNEPPRSLADGKVCGLSVAEENIRGLKGQAPFGTFAGAVLAPRTAPGFVIAYQTWYMSERQDVHERYLQRAQDPYVLEVERILRSLRCPDAFDRDGLVAQAPEVLLLDTLSARVKGAGSVLFAKMAADGTFTQWEGMGYRFALLYRHEILRAAPAGKPLPSVSVPRGANDPSDRFFRDRACGRIGDRDAGCYALRPVTGDTGLPQAYFVRSTEGWMIGDLREVMERSVEIDEAYRRSYRRVKARV